MSLIITCHLLFTLGVRNLGGDRIAIPILSYPPLPLVANSDVARRVSSRLVRVLSSTSPPVHHMALVDAWRALGGARWQVVLRSSSQAAKIQLSSTRLPSAVKVWISSV